MVNRTVNATASLSIDSRVINSPDNHASVSNRRDARLLSQALSSGRSTDEQDRGWERVGRTLTSGSFEEIDLFSFDGLDVGFGAGSDRVGQPLHCDKLVTIIIKHESGTGSLEVTPGNSNGWTPIGLHTVSNAGAIKAGGVIKKHVPHADALAIANESNHKIRFEASGGDVVYSVYLGLRSPSFLPTDITDLKLWLRADIKAEVGGSRTISDTATDYFVAVDTADLDFGTGDFTIECWVTRGDLAKAMYCCSKGTAAAGSYQLGMTSSGIFQAIIRDTATEVTHNASVSEGDLDAWNHVVWTADRSGNSSLYVNGVLNSTSDISTVNLSVDNADGLDIGRDRSGSIGNGDAARLRIWKGRLLVAGDVTYLYNSGEGLFHNDLGSALETSLVASYDLNESSGNAVDRLNSYDGVETGTPNVRDGPGNGTPVNNDPVERWTDQSRNARVFQQDLSAGAATGDARPLWIASAINSLPAVRFDGASTYLQLVENYLQKNSGTVIAVYQLTAALKDEQAILAASDVATNVHKITFRGYATSLLPNISSVQTDNDVADNVRGGTTLSAATTYIAVFSSSGSAYTFRLNGAGETETVITGADTGDWFADITGGDSVSIGASVSNSAQEFFKGDIAEIVAYDHELTAAEISSVESYLATRYGVTLPS